MNMRPYEEDIRRSVEVLREGGVILYPTDTIWGLGCDASLASAVQRIHRIKRRPPGKSYIILLSASLLPRYVPSLPAAVRQRMADADRPTTFVLSGVVGVTDEVRAPDGTVAVRLPRDAFCRDLLEAAERAIVSTSANPAGAPPPAHFGEIDEAIISGADYVVSWRRDDRTPTQPSRIVRILPDGSEEIIRE